MVFVLDLLLVVIILVQPIENLYTNSNKIVNGNIFSASSSLHRFQTPINNSRNFKLPSNNALTRSNEDSAAIIHYKNQISAHGSYKFA